MIVFSPDRLRDNASKFKNTTLELFTLARKTAKKTGLKGIYFIGCTPANSYWLNDYMPKNGYDALTAYNYHSSAIAGEFTGKEPPAVNYAQLIEGYKSQWSWILERSKLPYFVPITAGWDKRPWGSNSPHDSCSSTPESFKEMISKLKQWWPISGKNRKNGSYLCME